MSNTVTDIAYYIPAKYRKKVYTTLALVGLLLGASMVGFVSAGAGIPSTLIVANAVYVYVSTATHFMARSNVPAETPQV